MLYWFQLILWYLCVTYRWYAFQVMLLSSYHSEVEVPWAWRLPSHPTLRSLVSSLVAGCWNRSHASHSQGSVESCMYSCSLRFTQSPSHIVPFLLSCTCYSQVLYALKEPSLLGSSVLYSWFVLPSPGCACFGTATLTGVVFRCLLSLSAW